MTSPRSFDPVWTELYEAGQQLCRWPWDSVVTFVLREAPRDRPRAEVRILEVGCGAGANLWFAAREGFSVAGVDASPPAVAEAWRRFEADGLDADLRIADFTELPFADASFDLAIDRAALSCCGFSTAAKAVAEIHRVLRPGGRFFFNPYSDRCTSAASGSEGADRLRHGIDTGSLVGVGQLCFYNRAMIGELFATGWSLLAVQHVVGEEEHEACSHADWRVVAEKR